MDRANAELWNAVDAWQVRALAIGGRPRRIVRLDPDLTKAITTLRNPRGRGFTFLRQSNPAYHQLTSWFGPSVHSVLVAFRETEVQKLARKLMRRRCVAEKKSAQRTHAGRTHDPN